MKTARGFTLIEILLVFAIFAFLTAIVSITLLRPQQKFNLDTTVATVVSDVKEQQIRAMVGDSDGQTSAQDFGVRFENSPSNRYILFRGSTYNAGDTSNFIVSLPSPVVLTGTLPLTVVFQRRSGEIGTPITVTVQNSTSSEQKTLTINKLGGIVVN